MQYGDFAWGDVLRKLAELGEGEFANMKSLSQLEAGDDDIERRQLCEYLEMLPDAELLAQLGIVISLGRTDDDGFKSIYFNQGDEVAEVIEGLVALIMKLYPIAAPNISYGTDDWELTLELAICRKAALGIRNICELADMDELGAEDGDISTRVLPAIQSAYEMVKTTLGPDESMDSEVYGCLQVVVGWVGGQP